METVRKKSRKREAMLAALRATTEHPTAEMLYNIRILSGLVRKHNVEHIAIGNGTASRETEQMAVEMISQLGGGLSYAIVNEAGASVYSASKLAAEEFPDYDVNLRSAVSIARRW